MSAPSARSSRISRGARPRRPGPAGRRPGRRTAGRTRRRPGTARRRPRRTWPSRRRSPRPGSPPASSAARIAPTWPSIIPLGATTCAPAAAWATAMDAYRSSVASLSTSPEPVSSPQWPWSVYSSRHRSAMSTVASPTSAARSRERQLRGSRPGRRPPSPGRPSPPGCRTGSARRPRPRPPRPRPCAGCPGCAGPRPAWRPPAAGSLIPSLTNIGSTRSDGPDAGLRDQPAQRRGPAQPAGPGGRELAPLGNSAVTGSPSRPSGAAAGTPAALTGLAYRLPGRDGRLAHPGARTRPARSTRPVAEGFGAFTSTRRPNSAAVLAVCGPITAITVTACGLPAMPIRFRTVEEEVNSTASNPPPLIASRIGGGRRRRAHRAVRGDVLGLPAQLVQPGDQRLGGDIGPGQQDPVDRVEHARRRAARPRPAPRRTARPRAPGRA